MDNYLYIVNINILDNDNIYNKAYQSISKDRKEKVDKLKFIKDKKLSILAEIILKKALSELKLDNNVEYTYNKYKKPYLKSNVFFNISHSGEYVICALSDDEIGCDIEYIRDIDLKIAKKYFNNDEYDAIINSDNKLDLFYRYWTLKESFMKSLGLGFNLELDSFKIDIKAKANVIQNINSNHYYLKEVNIDDYKCSVCLANNRELKIKYINKIL